MAARINVIADDYGLSPGIGDAIRELIGRGKITGTSCMTLFPEWFKQAELLSLLPVRSGPDIGLHLTLTDFAPISRASDVEKMPPLSMLLAKSYLGLLDQRLITAELDAQLERFVQGIGRLPDFIDGHQHVHFLPVVRRWLVSCKDRLAHGGKLPWLRGSPRLKLEVNGGAKAKVAFVSFVATGFDRRMKATGFPVRGPLTGFYDWKRPNGFLNVIRQLEGELAEDAVIMCHPGWIDETLVSRDQMVEARPIEAEALALMPGVRGLDFVATRKSEDP